MAKDPEPGRHGVDENEFMWVVAVLAVIVGSMIAAVSFATIINPPHEMHSEQGCEK